jgi:hypothetical protein
MIDYFRLNIEENSRFYIHCGPFSVVGENGNHYHKLRKSMIKRKTVNKNDFIPSIFNIQFAIFNYYLGRR